MKSTYQLLSMRLKIQASWLLLFLFIVAQTSAQTPVFGDVASHTVAGGIPPSDQLNIYTTSSHVYDFDVTQAGIKVTWDLGDRTALPNTGTFSATIIVNITSNPAGISANKTLVIDQNTPKQVIYIPINPGTVTNYQYATVSYNVVSVSPAITNMARVTSEFVADVNYDATHNSTPSTSLISAIHTPSISGNEVTLDWSLTASPDKVPSYQVQVMRLRNINSTSTYNDPTNCQALIDWNQALTIETQSEATQVKLSLMEGTGYYAWRVRPIGNFYSGGAANPENWGVWHSSAEVQGSTNIYTTSSTASMKEVFYYTQPDEQINWNYQRSFSEGSPDDGENFRVAEQINYGNGLGQVLQNQQRLEDNDVIVSHQIQDYSNRPGLASMPVPQSGKSKLGFETGFLTKTGGATYTAADFDDNSNYDSPATIQDGTGTPYHYYSDGNSDKRIADAEEYPFTRALYKNDGTGRIKEQSNPGYDFRIQPKINWGTSRTTRTYYSAVADPELVRVFGDEAPLADNTYKIMTVDPNKVTSITYIEKNGKTLATCLNHTGTNNYNDENSVLDGLQSQEESAFQVDDTIKNSLQAGPYATISSKTLVLTNPVNTVAINYEITPQIIEDICSEYCMSCDYEILFTVKDVEENVVVHSETLVLGTELCGELEPGTYTASVNLGPGEYEFSKYVQTNNQFGSNGTYLNYHRDQMEQYYNDLIYGQQWAPILPFIEDPNNVDLVSFYDALGVDIQLPNAQQVFDDSTVTILIGCDEFELPINTCPTFNCEDQAIDEFVDYFVDLWQGEAFIQPDAMNKLPFLNNDYTEGEFEQMIKNMIEDGYDCEQLWTCWTAISDGYANLVAMDSLTYNGALWGNGISANTGQGGLGSNPPLGGLTYSFDMVDYFLNCVGYQYQGFSPNAQGTAGGVILGSATPGYLSHAYAYMNYTPGSSPMCESMNCSPNPFDPSCYGSWTSDKWFEFKRCVDGYVNMGWTSNSSTGYQNYITNSLNDMIATCNEICQQRVPSFRQAIINEHREAGLYIEGVDSLYLIADTILGGYPTHTPIQDSALPGGFTYDLSAYEFDCMVQAMLEHCQDGCDDVQLQIGAGGDTIGIGDSAAIAHLTQSMTWAFDIEFADPNCPDGYTTLQSTNLGSPNTNATGLAALWTQWLNGGGGIFGNGTVPPNFTATVPGSGNTFIAGNYTFVMLPNGTFQVFWTGTPPGSGNVTTIIGTPTSPHPYVDQLNDYYAQYYNYFIGNSISNVCVPYTGEYDLSPVAAMRLSQDIFLAVAFNYVNDSIAALDDFFTDEGFGVGTYGRSIVEPDSGNGTYNRRVLLEHLTSQLQYGLSQACYTIPNGRLPLEYYGGCTVQLLDTFQTVQALTGTPTLPYFGEDVNGYLTFTSPNYTSQNCTFNDIRFFTTDSLVFDTTLTWDSVTDPNGNVWPNGYFEYDSITGYINFIGQNDTIPISYFDVGTNPWSNCEFPDFCFKWLHPDSIAIPDSLIPSFEMVSCEQEVAENLLNTIHSYAYDVIEGAKDDIEDAYMQNCANRKAIQDKFWLSYSLNYHHYTLYYYDRADRLIRTVPPEGVDMVAPGSNRTVAPQHRLVTTYEYNSLNQVTAQHSSDGGKTLFWYDANQQLRFSQNAQQAILKTFSYTKYDALQRPITTGVSNAPAGSLDNYVNDPNYPLTGFEQTFTVYNTATAVTGPGGVNQEYLENRISYVYTDDDGDVGTTHDRVYTYYSYDPHGKVQWLVQDLPEMENRIIEYEYDLISGNVLQVKYAEGKADQFFHRYHYDGNNRLVKTETSRDGIIWDEDAAYEYYAHGPLERTVIGQDHIQGMDYTYTLQGWLKAINEPSLSGLDDGNDGDMTNPNAAGEDAFGMALVYHNRDFLRTGNPLSNGGTAGAMASASNRQLYNGNISTWSSRSQIPGGSKMTMAAHQYRYDEINRIKKADHHYNTGSWLATPGQYNTAYSYDANGNITQLYRESNTGLMDSLNYKYFLDGSGELLNNQLGNVSDNVNPGMYTSDIDNQMTGNYIYDAIGNLIVDQSENIAQIHWWANGKVRLIEYMTPHSDLEFKYDAMGNRVIKIERTKDAGGNLFPPEQWMETRYVLDASGNVMATYTREYVNNGPTYSHFYQMDGLMIYGSARLGRYKEAESTIERRTYDWGYNLQSYTYFPYVDQSNEADKYTRGFNLKNYELTDHLSNVRVVVNDRRYEVDTDANTIPDTYSPDVVSATDFYAFGSIMPGKDYASGGYRFGFNGQEKDDEVAGSGNSYTAPFWQYDPRTAHRWNLDPKPSAGISSYATLSGNPIWHKDPLGDTVSYGNILDRIRVGVTAATNKGFRARHQQRKDSPLHNHYTKEDNNPSLANATASWTIPMKSNHRVIKYSPRSLGIESRNIRLRLGQRQAEHLEEMPFGDDGRTAANVTLDDVVPNTEMRIRAFKFPDNFNITDETGNLLYNGSLVDTDNTYESVNTYSIRDSFDSGNGGSVSVFATSRQDWPNNKPDKPNSINSHWNIKYTKFRTLTLPLLRLTYD